MNALFALLAPISPARAVRYVFLKIMYYQDTVPFEEMGHVSLGVCGGEEGTDGLAVECGFRS
jgi:hypothetical protein